MKRFGFALACFLSLFSSSALAGIADSPLPELLPGEKTLHLYSVPGITSNGGLGTFFRCTSTDTAAIQAGVEIFSSEAIPVQDVTTTSLSIPPGATRTFGTFPAAWIGINQQVAGPGSQGSARILATSKKLVCTAFVADVGNAPPTSAWQLTIIAKLKQKAAN